MKNNAALLASLALCSSAAMGATYVNTDVADTLIPISSG